MWKPTVHYIALHYVYVVTLSFVGFIVLASAGNIPIIDAYLLATSAATVTGLTTINIKDLRMYQQLALYFIPTVGNMVFVSMLVVMARLQLFERRIREYAPRLLSPSRLWTRTLTSTTDQHWPTSRQREDIEWTPGGQARLGPSSNDEITQIGTREEPTEASVTKADAVEKNDMNPEPNREGATRIAFTDDVNLPPSRRRALYVPPPRERDRGQPLVEVDEGSDHESAQSARSVVIATDADFPTTGLVRHRTKDTASRTVGRVASSLFIHAAPPSPLREARRRQSITLSEDLGLPRLSSKATVGRNSQFHNLTSQDREELGGIEYRSLKLLLKVLIVYFVGLHLIGAIGLVAWIVHSDPKYRQVIENISQNRIWWAFFSAQTVTNNLGFTLTPDSMVSFQDAVFPMLFMTLLAYAGNTFYPCVLRMVLWTMSKAVRKCSSMHGTLTYLLKHPRRCYTHLFPSSPTWVLLAILTFLNAMDLILFILLDLHIHEVAKLPAGIRFLAVLFQVASSRHTGTSSFNLADVHPAIQFSLLVMMYISVFPIALSVRASNTYEESALGMFAHEKATEDRHSRSYFLAHAKNQLAFDLWYIFLGVFCICISEGKRIMDPEQPAFLVFPIFFEAVSAYANCGLSLGYPNIDTAFSSEFNSFSKVVLCFLMLRGRHRGMPSQIDRAVMLPHDLIAKDHEFSNMADDRRLHHRQLSEMRRAHTT